MAQPSELDTIFNRLSESYNVVKQNPSDPRAKAQLRNLARDLSVATQAPHEAGMSFVLSNAVHPSFLIAANMGIMKEWGKESMTSQELAEMTGGDARLIGKFLWNRVHACPDCFLRLLFFSYKERDSYTH
jgi:hypothetical protein